PLRARHRERPSRAGHPPWARKRHRHPERRRKGRVTDPETMSRSVPLAVLPHTPRGPVPPPVLPPGPGSLSGSPVRRIGSAAAGFGTGPAPCERRGGPATTALPACLAARAVGAPADATEGSRTRGVAWPARPPPAASGEGGNLRTLGVRCREPF